MAPRSSLSLRAITMEDDQKPEHGFYNRDPRRRTRWDSWERIDADTSVPAELAAAGWKPMSEVPKNRYVALYFRGGSAGDYEGSAAFYLEDDVWHVAQSKMIFTGAGLAIAWKRWTKQTLTAEPLPPKGRRG